MSFRITTTGIQSPVVFGDLGAYGITHPTTDFDLETVFREEDIRASQDVQTAIDSGYITVVDGNGDPITQTRGAVAHYELSGLSHDDHSQYLRTDGGRELSGDWDSGDFQIRADGGFKTGEAEVDLAAYLSITGKLSGGLVSQNSVDDQLLDITAGTAIVSDMSDLDNPRVKKISWDAMTIDPGYDENLIKWLGLEYNWDTGDTTAVVAIEFTPKQRRTIVVIARFWGTTPGSTEITEVSNYATPAFMSGKSLEDLTLAMGPVNYDGNNFFPSSIGLKLRRTAGKTFRYAANMTNDPLNPNIYESVDENPINSYIYQSATGITPVTYNTVQPDYYEDSTGNIILVPDDKWTVQKIYYYAVSNVVTITWGTEYYDTQSLARNGIVDDPDVYNSVLVGATLRAYLIVKKGATHLSDTNQATIVRAFLGASGLVPGFTNHGELGGLLDDDHPQYHNDTRGDALYYRKEYIEQSENIKYTYPGLTPPNYPFNVKTALDYNQAWVDDVGYSGRTSPNVVLVLDGSSAIVVQSGSGYIADGDQTIRVNWDSPAPFDFSSAIQGVYYFYVDETETVTYSNTLNTSFDIVRLGFIICDGQGGIPSVIQCPCHIDTAGNRIVDNLFQLGPFINEDSAGMASVSSNHPLAITVGQVGVHWALNEYNLPQIDTVDDLDNIFTIYKANDGFYYPNTFMYNPLGGNGKVGGRRWNDITQDPYGTVNGSFTFTNGSNIVTATGIDATSILDDYFIFLEDDGIDWMWPIVKGGVDSTGSEVTITLNLPYQGPGGTGNCGYTAALPYIPDGKYAKFILVRVLDQIGTLYIVPGDEVFDSEVDAKYGALPEYPDYVKKFDVRIAYLLGNSDITSWSGNIYDLRPLPFYREGGGGSGGGAVITSHSALADLNADDHLQYLRTDGTRLLTGIQKYSSQPSFTSDTAVITKKYVDDYFPVDHTTLTNKGTNTHAQIDTHIADTSIHFLKSSIDHNALINTHNLTTDIDHNLLTNTHNLTTNINHNTITNTHNLTTDIDHDQLTNFLTTEHFPWTDVTDYAMPKTPSGLWTILSLAYQISTTLASTTSTTYQNKLTITTPAVAGTYRIGFSMEFNSTSNNKNVEVRFYNSTGAVEINQSTQQTNSNANWFSFSGFHYYTQGATATTFSLQYRAGSASCQVRNAELELWRVA